MFEEFTKEYFEDQARSIGEEYGVDTRQGSVFMDAAEGHCIRTAKFFADLSSVFEMLAVDTCTGDILTEKAAQDGIKRLPATPSIYNVTFVGATPEVGTRFFAGTYYFTIVKISNVLYLQSEISGTETNGLVSGIEAVPVYDIDGLTSSTLGSLSVAGTATENDVDLRTRWQQKKSGPSQNGNTSHYKTWCEECIGVGRAHVLPLKGGENTVAAIIYSTEGVLPASSVISTVQDYIDPIDEGYEVTVGGVVLTFGDGLGNAKGNLGAHFLALSPTKVEISIAFNADIRTGYTTEQAQAEVLADVIAYLKDLVLDGDESITVRVSAIGNIISSTDSILDYSPSSLTLNSSSSNITIGKESAPVAKEVLINA